MCAVNAKKNSRPVKEKTLERLLTALMTDETKSKDEVSALQRVQVSFLEFAERHSLKDRRQFHPFR